MSSGSPPASASSMTLDQVYVELTKDHRIFADRLERGLKRITQTCARSMGVDRVSVWAFDAEIGALSCLCLWDQNSAAFEHGAVLKQREIPRYFEALSSQRLIDASDARQDSRTSELTDDYLIPLNIHAMLDATLRFEGRLRGVLCTEVVGKSRAWSEAEKMFVSSVAELIDQLMILDRLRQRESHYRSLFDHSADSIFLLSDGVFVDCNPATETIFETSRKDLMGLNLADISPEHQPDGRRSSEVAEQLIQRALEGDVQRFEWRHRTMAGQAFDCEVMLSRAQRGDDWYVTGVVRDISGRKQIEQELKKSRSDLEYRAYHDSLTALPNRDQFHLDANASIQKDEEPDVHHAVYLLDLNRFKEVNDALGHEFGDEVLKQVGERLREFSESNNHAVYRLGGDEFALLAAVESEQDALQVAEQVMQSFLSPFSQRDIDLHVDTSIGIALSSRHGVDSHELLRCADVALYIAKREAKHYSLYEHRFDDKGKRHLTLMSDLVQAMEYDELMLYYHPRVELENNTCTNCEALLRWQHPKHGLINPDEFIATAELNNHIHQLTRWVLNEALGQLRSWLDQGMNMTVSVNVSARNLVDQRFSEDVRSLLEKHRIQAEQLELEITESALIIDPVRALESLDVLRAFGVSIAVDDFGTGYSSMSYLKRMPVQVLKIDRSFVKDMLTDESDATIVRSIVELAHQFGLLAVAEGVEDLATIELLKKMNCEQAQGFYFCNPLPAKDFKYWLSRFKAD